MFPLLCFFLAVVSSSFKSKSQLEAENVALRQQLIVLRRKMRGRVRLTNNDRWFFVQLYRWFPSILPVLTIIRAPVVIGVAYLIHGIEHILFGFDHLLFVLALILIIRDLRLLLLTVTAFTVAHSITLSLARLGLVHVPGPPVEASIALSILLLACEIVRVQRGEYSLTASYPWVVAFSFGLLHGFGFASALTGIGLPKEDVPLALVSFNVGVELGQIAFIAGVLALIAGARRLSLPTKIERIGLMASVYAIGSLAAFWCFDRVTSVFGLAL